MILVFFRTVQAADLVHVQGSICHSLFLSPTLSLLNVFYHLSLLVCVCLLLSFFVFICIWPVPPPPLASLLFGQTGDLIPLVLRYSHTCLFLPRFPPSKSLKMIIRSHGHGDLVVWKACCAQINNLSSLASLYKYKL